MGRTFDERIAIVLLPEAVRTHGNRSEPRSYGVYRLAGDAHAARRDRFGAPPALQDELAREFGGCERVHAFLARGDVEAVARPLNGPPPQQPH